MPDKRPAAKAKSGGKKPVASPDSVSGKHLRFRFHLVDVGSEWCLSKITPEAHQELLTKLGQFESMTVGAVFSGSPGKDYDYVTNKDANAALKAKFGSTEVSRLRLSGKARLYGIRQNEFFSILWWDPEHAIWPTEK